jgi:hypothetical protein
VPDPITLETLQGALNADQKTFLDNHIKATTDAAVQEFKTKADAERMAKVPENYEIKFSDGTPLDPVADKEKIVAHLKANGFSNEQAAAHLQHLDETARAVVSRTAKANESAMSELTTKYRAEVELDPVVGGAKLTEARANIDKALEWAARFDPTVVPLIERFKKEIGETPYGNYLPYIRLFDVWGKGAVLFDKAIREGKIISGPAGGGKGPKDLKEALYGVKTG